MADFHEDVFDQRQYRHIHGDAAFRCWGCGRAWERITWRSAFLSDGTAGYRDRTADRKPRQGFSGTGKWFKTEPEDTAVCGDPGQARKRQKQEFYYGLCQSGNRAETVNGGWMHGDQWKTGSFFWSWDRCCKQPERVDARWAEKYLAVGNGRTWAVLPLCT